MNRVFEKIVAWLREGYPNGVPPTDRVPVLALLTRPLSPTEAVLVAEGEGAE